MKILMAAGETNRGGTETWLLHIARELQGRCQIDFLVHNIKEGAYDAQLTAAGARIITCVNPGNPFAFGFRLLRTLRRSGPYDAVHSHVQCYSAWILLIAWVARVPLRIVHSHSDIAPSFKAAGFLRKGYMRAMKALLQIVPTHYIATSSAAAKSLFGSQPYRQHLSCIDLNPLAQHHCRAQVRSFLGIPHESIVVGHIGSFRPEKNHGFALQVAAALLNLSPRYRFLFKGEGALKPEIQAAAAKLGIAQNCLFLPADDAVPEILRGALDLFLFPSLSEGLGLAAVEAQAAGLRCFLSEAIPRETIAVPQLVERLPLDIGPNAWAASIHAMAGTPAPLPPEEAFHLTCQAGFDMRRNAQTLLDWYTSLATAKLVRASVPTQHYSVE